MTSGLSRRGFLTKTAAGLVAAGLPEWYANEVAAHRAATAMDGRRSVAQNDKLAFGLVGCGGMGRGDVNRFIRRRDCQLVALCDVDQKHLEEANKQFGGKNELYKNYRDLIARKDLDFVIVATPDHWHTLPTVAAMKAGKDVYCEKPLTLTVDEGKQMVKVAGETGRIVQTGSQQRSEGSQWRMACELIRNNRLGKLKEVRTQINEADRGGPFKTAPVPESLDWDFWQGPTPYVEFVKERCHYTFRWWYDYSGGKVTDWGAHHNDIAQWALGMDDSGPVAVESKGEVLSPPGGYTVHNKFEIRYKYANGVPLICTSEGENGVKFIGENGEWIFVNRNRQRFHASDGDRRESKILGEPLPKDAVRLEVSRNHGSNFISCIKSREQPICNVNVGHRSVTVCHIGNISLRLGGRALTWDPKKEMFIGDDEANAMLSRPARSPWKMEA